MSDSDLKELHKHEINNFIIAENYYDKSMSLSNQIQLKLCLTTTSHFNDLSSDIKSFIRFHLLSLDIKEVHYDQLQFELIINYIEKVNIEEKIILTKFLLRELKKYGHDEYIDLCTEKINHYERLQLKSKKGFWNGCKRLYLYSICSPKTIFFFLLIIYCVFSIILLPAYFDWMEFYKVQYVEISDSKLLNHFLNTFGALFSLFDDFKVIPKNTFALILMVASKILFLLYIVNILSDQLIKKLNK